MAERLRIARLGAGGDGVADTPGGPIFVPGALPGEEVEAEVERGRGRLNSVLAASPDRAEPFCPYFGRCGGCSAQHMGPDLYASWKRGRLLSAMRSAGLDEAAVGPLAEAGGAGRRRITLHGRRKEDGRGVAVGFMEPRSHHLVPIERCPAAVPALGDAPAWAGRLADALRSVGKPIDLAVTATEAGQDIDLRGTGPLPDPLRQRLIGLAAELDLARLSLHGEVLIERRAPTIPFGPARVRIPPGGFLQATEAGETAIAGAVRDGVGDARRIADLFSGAGPFALRLAERAEVHAVETDVAALKALDRAARETPGLRRVTTETRDLFRRPLLPLELDRFESVVLDPPRAGAEAQARQLAASRVGRVAMVSCDPGTFARDAAILEAGGLRLSRAVPVDQFRWTAHLEIVGLFQRAATRRPGQRRPGRL